MKKKKKTFNQSWLHSSYDSISYDAQHIVSACRDVLSGKNENEIRKLAKESLKEINEFWETALNMPTYEALLKDKEVRTYKSFQTDKSIKKLSDFFEHLKKIAETKDIVLLILFYDKYTEYTDSIKYSLIEVIACMALLFVEKNDLETAYKLGFMMQSGMLYNANQDIDNLFIQLNHPITRKALETGIKVLRSMEKGREASAKIRSKKSYDEKKKWIKIAIEKWQNNPGWSNKDMAEYIKDVIYAKHSVGTILNAIKGKKSALFDRR